MMNDIKIQIKNIHRNICKDISSPREEATADTNELRNELSQKLDFIQKQEIHRRKWRKISLTLQTG